METNSDSYRIIKESVLEEEEEEVIKTRPIISSVQIQANRFAYMQLEGE
jgi:hypothetical protein